MTTRTLTPVFDGAIDLPVRVGWYPCWPKRLGRDWPDRDPGRRYWDGRWFSVYVKIGECDDMQDQCKKTLCSLSNNELYWCGLTAPYES